MSKDVMAKTAQLEDFEYAFLPRCSREAADRVKRAIVQGARRHRRKVPHCQLVGHSFLKLPRDVVLIRNLQLANSPSRHTTQTSGFSPHNCKLRLAYPLLETRSRMLKAPHRPIKYAGYSTNFRREAGSHGKDAWGTFRYVWCNRPLRKTVAVERH